jgi:hypothetical protein
MADHNKHAFHDGCGANALQDTKAQEPRGIKEEIMRLRDGGLYAIPVRIDWNSETSKKDATFPRTWHQIIDLKSWYASISTALLQQADANGVAILTGPSGLYAIDIDVDVDNPKKLPGIDLWNRLINIHGEPDTLRARTALEGLHYLFRSSPGLSSQKNFATVKNGKDTFALDGRGLGGVIFAEPTAYVREGQLVNYEWLNGPPSYKACKEMPGWVKDLVNNRGDALSAENPKNDIKLSTTCAQSDNSDSIPSNEAQSSCGEYTFNGLSIDKSLLLAELCKLLKEKANNTTSTYANSVPHSLYGTYYCC